MLLRFVQVTLCRFLLLKRLKTRHCLMQEDLEPAKLSELMATFSEQHRIVRKSGIAGLGFLVPARVTIEAAELSE